MVGDLAEHHIVQDGAEKMMDTLQCHQTWHGKMDHLSVISMLNPALIWTDMGLFIAMFDDQRVFLDEGSFLTIGFKFRSVSHDLPGVSLTGFEILRVSPVRRPW